MRIWGMLVLWGGLAAADTLPDVPQLSTQAPARAQVEQGRKLNIEALMLHRAKKLDAAIAKYAEALRADPSNTIARYNLASALATKGDTRHALEVLGQFRVATCAACVQRLRDAQTDKEWQALWKDPAFRAVVDFAPSTAAKGTGPVAPVIEADLQLSAPDPAPPLPTNTIRVHAFTEVEAGFYQQPALEAVLRGPKGVVSHTPFPASTLTHLSADVVIPGAGAWAIDVIQSGQNGKPLASLPLVAEEVRCLGGARTLSFEPTAGAHLETMTDPGGQEYWPTDDEPGGPAPKLEFEHEALFAGDGAAVVEWRRGGKVVVSETKQLFREQKAAPLDAATSAADLDQICPVQPIHDDFDFPTDVLDTPGAWELRVYERDAPAYAMTFSWKKGHTNGVVAAVKPIPTPSTIQFDAPRPARDLGAELRAMLRSKDAVTARLALNAARRANRDAKSQLAQLDQLAKTSGAPFTDTELPLSAAQASLPKVSLRRTKLAVPQLPAVSPDGKLVAIRDEVEFWQYEGDCAPPAGDQLVAFEVAGKGDTSLSRAPVPDLAKLKPLRCGLGKLAGGLEIVRDDDMNAILRDRKGAVLAKLHADGNGLEACIASDQKLFVLLDHGQVGGDCDVVGGWDVKAVRY